MRKFILLPILSVLLLAGCSSSPSPETVSDSGPCVNLLEDYHTIAAEFTDYLGNVNWSNDSEVRAVIATGRAAVDAGRSIEMSCSTELPSDFSDHIDAVNASVNEIDIRRSTTFRG